MAEKPVKYGEKVEVTYGSHHLNLFGKLRKRAITLMSVLAKAGYRAVIHGSVARGDVDVNSDIDVLIPYVTPSYKIELTLTNNQFEIFSRIVAQATPTHAPKAHIYLDPTEQVCVTFPLIDFRSLELEFYKFGGLLELDELKQDKRVSGCTKRLTLIEPTRNGHVESPVFGHEAEVARTVGVSIDIVKERVRVLTRRDKIGRTGIFLLATLERNEVFEEVLKRLIDTNPALRRKWLDR